MSNKYNCISDTNFYVDKKESVQTSKRERVRKEMSFSVTNNTDHVTLNVTNDNKSLKIDFNKQQLETLIDELESSLNTLMEYEKLQRKGR